MGYIGNLQGGSIESNLVQINGKKLSLIKGTLARNGIVWKFGGGGGKKDPFQGHHQFCLIEGNLNLEFWNIISLLRAPMDEN